MHTAPGSGAMDRMEFPVSASGLQKTAYLLLMAFVVYVWVVGG